MTVTHQSAFNFFTGQIPQLIFFTAHSSQLLFKNHNSTKYTLNDIGKISIVKNIIHDAKSITNLLYAHVRLLAIMRKYTNGDLVRASTTRFAASYLNLKSLYMIKEIN